MHISLFTFKGNLLLYQGLYSVRDFREACATRRGTSPWIGSYKSGLESENTSRQQVHIDVVSRPWSQWCDSRKGCTNNETHNEIMRCCHVEMANPHQYAIKLLMERRNHRVEYYMLRRERRNILERSRPKSWGIARLLWNRSMNNN